MVSQLQIAPDLGPRGSDSSEFVQDSPPESGSPSEASATESQPDPQPQVPQHFSNQRIPLHDSGLKNLRDFTTEDQGKPRVQDAFGPEQTITSSTFSLFSAVRHALNLEAKGSVPLVIYVYLQLRADCLELTFKVFNS
ncbi:hypothetical protein G7Y89_g10091 [Cudoniella acicularis]|uniref:Uncharacterized protein n=1 Tax=Cudoniella acicularis TaxID=354080 RepID=A0A8H4REG3_9HELO|nr:hypothetical protein G7Y89_g10091 [Cudoniella acicularis]